MAPRVIGSSEGSLQEATAAAFDDEAFKEVDQMMRRCAGSRCTPSSRRSSPPDAPRRGGIMAGGCLTTAKDVLSLPEVELMALLKEICPRGNNNIVIIIFLVHDNVYTPCYNCIKRKH
jgi:hypothetical protein